MLQNFTAVDKNKILYIPWKVSWPLPRLVSDDAECVRRDISWSEYFPFLPMVDMDPTNISCIFLHSSLVLRYGATPVLIFDQPCGGKPRRSLTIVRVSTRVVVVVVRELFSLVMSAICVRIRGRGQRLRRLFTTWLKLFVYCCVLTTVNS